MGVTMAGIDDLLRALPIDQVASKLGVDRDTATRAVQEGGTTILTGLERNAQTPSFSLAPLLTRSLKSSTSCGASLGGWPEGGRSRNPSGPRRLKRCTQRRSERCGTPSCSAT